MRLIFRSRIIITFSEVWHQAPKIRWASRTFFLLAAYLILYNSWPFDRTNKGLAISFVTLITIGIHLIRIWILWVRILNSLLLTVIKHLHQVDIDITWDATHAGGLVCNLRWYLVTTVRLSNVVAGYSIVGTIALHWFFVFHNAYCSCRILCETFGLALVDFVYWWCWFGLVLGHVLLHVLQIRFHCLSWYDWYNHLFPVLTLQYAWESCLLWRWLRIWNLKIHLSALLQPWRSCYPTSTQLLDGSRLRQKSISLAFLLSIRTWSIISLCIHYMLRECLLLFSLSWFSNYLRVLLFLYQSLFFSL